MGRFSRGWIDPLGYGGALAIGEVGDGLDVSGDSMEWSAVADLASPGQVVRVVRPTGEYLEYSGIGYFADETLSPADKGMPVHQPVGEASVTDVEGGMLTLSHSLSIAAGDIVYLGEAWPESPEDGQPARFVAGKPGTAFSKVLLDSDGNRHVPHYRAVDMASDNRIAPGTYSLTEYAFHIPAECSSGTVRASLWYRPVPLSMASIRGWDAQDYQIAVGAGSW